MSTDVPYADRPNVHAADQLQFLQALVDQHARIAGDIVVINTTTWAIHGTIPVDGDVLMAEFDDLGQARAVLQRLVPPLAT